MFIGALVFFSLAVSIIGFVFAVRNILAIIKDASTVAKQKPLVPDVPVGSVEMKIRTHDNAFLYQQIGKPTKIGDRVDVNMESGKTAVYELVNIERASGTSWNWYDLEFIGYKTPAKSAKGSS